MVPAQAAEEGPEAAHDHHERGEGAARVDVALDPEEQRADQDGDQILDELHGEELGEAADAVKAAEVGQPDPTVAEAPQVAVKHEIRGQHHRVEAAEEIGEQGRNQKQDPVDHAYSFSPF